MATLLKGHGMEVKVLQELLRHSTSKVSLDVYNQAMTPAKRLAQGLITGMLSPSSSEVMVKSEEVRQA
jgi:hypothetical protein